MKRGNYIRTPEIREKQSLTAKERLKIPENNSNFKDGRTLKTYYCKECFKKGILTIINWQTAIRGSGLCRRCASKKQGASHLIKISKSKKGKKFPGTGISRFGKDNPNFKGNEAETKKKHYCIESNCNNEISYQAWKEGQGRCNSCEMKRRFDLGIMTQEGENNNNWQGGIGKLPYPFEFNNQLKEQIRKRDNYTCQKCNITEEEHLIVYGKVLSIHHIDYDKDNLNDNNLISLCIACNFRVNYNRDYWENYFKEKRCSKS